MVHPITSTSSLPKFTSLVGISLIWVGAIITLIHPSWSGIIPIFFLAALLPSSVLLKRANKLLSLHTFTSICIAGLFGGFIISAFHSAIQTLFDHNWLSVSIIQTLNIKFIASLTLGLIGIHGIHLYLYHILSRRNQEKTLNRIGFYISVALPTIMINFGQPKALIIILLASSAYFLLLDLFSEVKDSNNIIWLVVWTLILGSILAIGINGHIISNGDKIPMVHAISVFSLSFILSGILYSTYAAVNRKIGFLPREWNFYLTNHRQLQNRIQFAILATLIFSFIAIGVVSIYQFKSLVPRTAINGSVSFTLALLNTYVFLFIIGFAISFILSEYIRNPLVELGRTLKNVKLNKSNKKISWNGTDEIAGLINEYNLMIDKLEENTQLLTQVERDHAWREMAKQVAHEIKNPLTPMKLSLQYLEKSIQYKREDIESLALRMCDTLKSQVDNLQQIADTFATFGSLPKTDNQKVLLNEIMETIHDLFRNREDMDIQLIEPIDDIGVYADKNQLVRVLNNLVKNSIQAIPEGRKGQIELHLKKDTNKAVIEVRDNGKGMSESEKQMIFKPKFTTKTSGSGLGLAISANIIDSMGGTIYFDSEENIGTTFYVELPLIRYDFSETSNRVMLED